MTIQPSNGKVPDLTIAERLHIARFMAGLDIQELAAATGISRDTIRHYESREWASRRSPAFLRLWADATGYDLEWIKTGQAGPDNTGPGLTSVAGTGFEPVTSGSLGAEVIPLRVARTAPRGVPERPAAVEGERTAA